MTCLPPRVTAAAPVLLAMLLCGCSGMASPPVPAVPAAPVAQVVSAAAPSSQLERCAKPLGNLALVEVATLPWLGTLRSQYKLDSVLPLLRVLVRQSNCFTLAEPGKQAAAPAARPGRKQAGARRNAGKVARTPLLPVDFTVTPAVAFGSAEAGGPATTLAIADATTGAVIAEALGSARNWDPRAPLLLEATAATAYGNSAHGKVLAASLCDAYNSMVHALRAHLAVSPRGAATKPGGTGRVL